MKAIVKDMLKTKEKVINLENTKEIVKNFGKEVYSNDMDFVFEKNNINIEDSITDSYGARYFILVQNGKYYQMRVKTKGLKELYCLDKISKLH